MCISVHAACASAGQAVQSLCRNASEYRTRPYESWQSTVHWADDEKPYCFCVPVQLFSLYLPSSHAETVNLMTQLTRTLPARVPEDSETRAQETAVFYASYEPGTTV